MAKKPATTDQAVRWLMLIFTLPAKRASERVEVWRKIKRSGALALGTSGYLLPFSAANQERFEWIASAIRSYKGQASVAQVHSIDDAPDDELRARFSAARARDYEELMAEAKKPSARRGNSAGQARLRRRFDEIASVDFFNSPLRSRAEALLVRMAASAPPATATAPTRAARKDFLNRTWVTRPRPGIDRVSSAWLIRRFIDESAKFAFATDARQLPEAVPFDMFQPGGFGHRGDDCTFETLRKDFGIRDGRVAAIAEIVHDADLGDQKFGRSEGVGIDRVLVGWAHQDVSDAELLRRGMELIEGLFRSVSSAPRPG